MRLDARVPAESAEISLALKKAVVTLNGLLVSTKGFCVCADEEQGYIEIYIRKNKEIVKDPSNGMPLLKKVYGKVKIEYPGRTIA